MTRPGAGPASAMVTRSRAREDRGVNTIRETEFRPEMEIRPETDILAEIPITREGGSGTTRSSISDTASQYVTADRPETAAAFTATLEINPISPITPKTLPLTHE